MRTPVTPKIIYSVECLNWPINHVFRDMIRYWRPELPHLVFSEFLSHTLHDLVWLQHFGVVEGPGYLGFFKGDLREAAQVRDSKFRSDLRRGEAM